MKLSYGLRNEINTQLLTAHKQAQLLTLRAQIMHALRGYGYVPERDFQCYNCRQNLSLADILYGFADHPTINTVTCRYCDYTENHVKLIQRGATLSRAELPFYCASQVLHYFENNHLVILPPEQIEKRAPAYAHSAIVHFGNYNTVFAELGLAYAFDKVPDWLHKVKDFFGKAPDTIIAACVGISVKRVSKARNDLGIPPWNSRKK